MGLVADFPWGVGTPGRGCRDLPHYEVGMCPLHDLLLRADVLLLSRIHNVAFLENLHGKGFGFFTFQLDLKEKTQKISEKKATALI